MVRILLAVLTIIVWFAPMSGQQVTQAFYVYLNNAPLKPYFYSEVDSICHSTIDVDSVERQEFVVTEIWTSDSVYRIPMETIDSIAFTTPAEKRKPGAIELTQEALGYLVSVDSLTLTFQPTMPDRLLPEVGNMLTYSASSEAMPYGFLGRVREVRRSRESGITVDCDSIGVADAFDRLFLVGAFSSGHGGDRVASRASAELEPMYIKPINKNFDILTPLHEYCEWSVPLDDNFNFGMSESYFDIIMNYAPTGEYTIIKDGIFDTNYILHLDGPLSVTTDIGLNYNLSADLGSKLPKFDTPLPVPYTFGRVRLEIKPEVSLTGKMAIKTKRVDSMWLGFYMNLTTNCNLKSTVRIKKPKDYSRTWNTELYSAELDLFLGAYAGLYIGLMDNKLYAGVSAGFDVNNKFAIGPNDFLSATKTTALYDRIVAEDVMSFEFQVKPKVGFESENLLDQKDLFDIHKEWEFAWPLSPSSERSVFPKFSEPKYVENGAETHLECEVSGETYFSVLPGIKVFDENGDSIYAGYHYDVHNFGTTKYELPYLHQVVNKKCMVYPTFKIFGYEIVASPGVPLELRAVPVTDNAVAQSTSAVVMGHIKINTKTNMNIVSNDYSVGFCYSSSSADVHNGRRVPCELNADRTFSATLDGLKEESDYYYCAYITVDGSTEYGETLKFVTHETEEVDLGLSVNWRAWNLGASHSYQEGYRYAWAEIDQKTEYTWDTYFDNPYSSDSEWVGCTINQDISGNSLYDPSTGLENGWRMPSREEMQELLDECEWTWTQNEGVNGYRVTGPNGNSIFLPVTGLADGTSINNSSTYGAYWTSTPQTDAEGKATASTLYFYGATLKSQQWANRYGGRAIRPVR